MLTPSLVVLLFLLTATQSSIADEDLIQSMLPSTLIDLGTMTIKQTHPYHEYSVLRKEFQNMQVESLVQTKPRENLWTAAQYVDSSTLFFLPDCMLRHGLFRPVKAAAPCIHQLIGEVLSLPLPVREAYLSQSLRAFVRKAVLLVKYVEAELYGLIRESAVY